MNFNFITNIVTGACGVALERSGIEIREGNIAFTAECFTWTSAKVEPERFEEPHVPCVAHVLEIAAGELGLRVFRLALCDFT